MPGPHPQRLRDRANALRASGVGVRAIARELGIAQSTASLWTREAAPLRPLSRFAVDQGVVRALVVWSSERTKRCPRCGAVHPVELFGLRTDGQRQGWCRPCFRAHARARGAAHRAQVAASKERRRAIARAWILDHLRTRRCVDCGTPEIVVLEFDHIGEKHGHVGSLVANGTRLERIVAEVARCEVVCANCHRRRTARQAGWWRASSTWRSELGAIGTPRARNQLHVLEHLSTQACVDCGEADIVVLDLDHVGEKTGNVSSLVRRGCSIARIDAEIAQCVVRCANCHRRRTSADRGHWRSTLDAPPATAADG